MAGTTIDIPTNLADPAGLLAIIGPIIAAAGFSITPEFKIVIFPGINIGLPLPSELIPDTSVRVRVSQTCPGFPACGRLQGPCKISKSTPFVDPLRPAKQRVQSMVPALPSAGPSFKIPELAVSIKLPKIGFQLHCPNAQAPQSADKNKPLNPYDQQGQPAPQR